MHDLKLSTHRTHARPCTVCEGSVDDDAPRRGSRVVLVEITPFDKSGTDRSQVTIAHVPRADRIDDPPFREDGARPPACPPNRDTPGCCSSFHPFDLHQSLNCRGNELFLTRAISLRVEWQPDFN